jgi:putative sporulation protein YtaF
MSSLALLLFSFFVSLDGFFAGTAYGISKINVSAKALLIIGLLSLVSTALSMLLAHTVAACASLSLFGAFILIALGVFSLSFNLFKKSPSKAQSKEFSFSVGKIVVHIMRRPECADLDRSNDLSAAEAFFLGLALGLDNTAATFAAALNEPLPLFAPVLIFITQIFLIRLGIKIGFFISPKYQRGLSLLPPVYFILLGLKGLIL